MINKAKLMQAERFEKQGFRVTIPACNVSFFFHPSKSGPHCGTIYAKLLILNKKGEISTGVFVDDRSTWKSASNTVVGHDEKTRRLTQIKAEIEAVFTERFVTDRSLDPKVILKIAAGLRGHDEEKTSVLNGIDAFIAYHQERIGIDIAENTLKSYKQYRNRIKEFLIHYKYGIKIGFDELKPSIASELTAYMKNKRKYGHNYSIKVCQFLRTCINYAVSYEWAARNPIGHVRFKQETKEIKSLTERQVQQCIDGEFVSPALEKVRDIFIFQCFTGLAYSDVRELKTSQLFQTEKGEFYIEKPRKKTNVVQFIPLLEPALAILNKYDKDTCRNHGLLLPVPSNAKMNQYLKDIQDILNIPERLHTHIARKTCTTLFIVNGVPQTTTCQVMGFSLRMMQKHYLSVRKDIILSDVNNAFKGKFGIHRSDDTLPNQEAI